MVRAIMPPARRRSDMESDPARIDGTATALESQGPGFPRPALSRVRSKTAPPPTRHGNRQPCRGSEEIVVALAPRRRAGRPHSHRRRRRGGGEPAGFEGHRVMVCTGLEIVVRAKRGTRSCPMGNGPLRHRNFGVRRRGWR
jgi:hypothetical protein